MTGASSRCSTATYSYDVFGAIRSQDPPGGSNPWLFTGEQRDADSDLQYLRARYYDSAIGRFLGLDPVGQGNGYSYVANNPATFTDPTGLCIFEMLCLKLPKVNLAQVSKTAVRMNLSMTPVIGDVNDAIAVVTGYDIIWGERISREERALYAAGLVFGSGSMYRKGLGMGADGAHLAPRIEKVRANSFASTKPTTLYQLMDKATGRHLKWGISGDLRARYTEGFMRDKRMIPIVTGTRQEMFATERWLVERLPGPLNHEPWAGARRWEFPY